MVYFYKELLLMNYHHSCMISSSYFSMHQSSSVIEGVINIFPLQGGEDSQDALSVQVNFRKRAL